MNLTRRFAALGIALALVALACGGGTADENADGPAPPATVTDDTPTGGSTPLADDAAISGLSPLASGTCPVGTPDCQDTPLGGDEPPFVDGEPDLGVDPGDSSGMVVGEGLTVEEALATDAEGVIAVQGFIVSDASGIRLCGVLAESMPPQCGGASVQVSDLATVDPDDLTSAQGVTWSDQPVTILGEIIEGTLIPTPFSR